MVILRFCSTKMCVIKVLHGYLIYECSTKIGYKERMFI